MCKLLLCCCQVLSEALEVMEKQLSEMEQSHGSEGKRGGASAPATVSRADSKGPLGPVSGGIGTSGDPLVIGAESITPMLALLHSLRAENREWRLLATRRMMSSLLASPLPRARLTAEPSSCEGVEEQKESVTPNGKLRSLQSKNSMRVSDVLNCLHAEQIPQRTLQTDLE